MTTETKQIKFTLKVTETKQNIKDFKMEDFKIYVASLSDYNAGILHGIWIDFNNLTSAEDIQTQVNNMLKESPILKKLGEPAEEWAIHDYEGFENVSEYAGFDELFEEFENYISLEEDEIEAYKAYTSDIVGKHYATVEGFKEDYQGFFESEKAFCENWVDEIGLLNEVPENLAYYFDYAAYSSDLFITDFISSSAPGGVYVFARN